MTRREAKMLAIASLLLFGLSFIAPQLLWFLFPGIGNIVLSIAVGMALFAALGFTIALMNETAKERYPDQDDYWP